MQVAQRNTAFKAGGFFQMSLLTFVMVGSLKEKKYKYSFFIIMRLCGC